MNLSLALQDLLGKDCKQCFENTVRPQIDTWNSQGIAKARSEQSAASKVVNKSLLYTALHCPAPHAQQKRLYNIGFAVR